jgi:dTDP-4-dehydrorhamnose reductase
MARNAMRDRDPREAGSIVVTGASGLLGSSFVLCAQGQKRTVTAVSHLHSVNIPGVDPHRVNLADSAATLALIDRIEPGSIVHCAAATDVDWCEDHPEQTTRINVDAPGLLAKFAYQHDVPFVYISTDAVFDGNLGCYSESDDPCPVNVYAASKLQGEREVLRQNPNSVIARVTMYGWSARRKPSLGEWVFDSLSAGQSVSGFSDVYFSPILVNDLCDVILALLDRAPSGIFHVVGSQRISKYEFARSVARVFGFPTSQIVSITVGESGLRARRPQDTSLSTDKVAKALGRPMPDVDSGLRRFRELQENGYRQMLENLLTGEVG